ncbi:MAG: hydrogenase 4 subunit B, partial [Rhodocyclaceae bacterium]|nr:hydrogenase 4 subunit B [Rhodocyclaceae bacterium]
MFNLLSVDYLLIAMGCWLCLGVAGLFLSRRVIARGLFALGALTGLLVSLVALSFLGNEPETAVLVIGLPNLPFHLRLDNLSAVFVLLLGIGSTGISLYASGQFGKGDT